MPLPPRLFPGDEELGKRDDDHKPGTVPPLSTFWHHRRRTGIMPPSRRVVKRALVALASVVALYFFFKNMPDDLSQPPGLRPSYNHQPGGTPGSRLGTGANAPYQKQDDALKAKNGLAGDAPEHFYNGPIKFYDLATTLRVVHGNSMGGPLGTQNVVFAAYSLKSASILLPIACEMESMKKNRVHFVLLGRDDIPMDILKSVNGVGKECDIMFHDGRPDFALESSEFRMEVSVSAALKHVNDFTNYEAVIIDGSEEEDPIMLRAAKARLEQLEKTLIPLPANPEDNLMWITRLDSTALKSWDLATIDIVIHAQPSATGSLIRLLNSLTHADYFGSPPPRLTIELPHKIDAPTQQFLKSFTWPPVHKGAEKPATNQLTLHHRIPQHGLTPEENSIRFLESFWPAKPHTSHILVLSPTAELSPLYFHYLKYAMLSYRYSATSYIHGSNLLSISLDLPSVYLNDSAPFTPPPPPALPKEDSSSDLWIDNAAKSDAKNEQATFLWQAPNSNAALFFGDKWAELHSFTSHLLTSLQNGPNAPALGKTFKEQVAHTYPAWLEHILKLARVRGYWTLYPVVGNDEALVTLHNELYHLPEEYSSESEAEKEKDEKRKIGGDGEKEEVLGADMDKNGMSRKAKERPLVKGDLLKLLPGKGLLPQIEEIPLLGWDGTSLGTGADKTALNKSVEEYAELFRREIGGCGKGAKPKERVEGSVKDLFCLDDDFEDEVLPLAGAKEKGDSDDLGGEVVGAGTVKGKDAPGAPSLEGAAAGLSGAAQEGYEHMRSLLNGAGSS